MRILTVRQPWAWAIIHAGKDVENRVRNIAGDYRGPVAIHAGLREDTAARQHPEIQRIARETWWTTPDDMLTGRLDQFGRIIGVVDLVSVHHESDPMFWCAQAQPDPDCERAVTYSFCSPWAQLGAHHLVLARPRPLAEPIPYKGALGLRALDEAATARVLEAIV